MTCQRCFELGTMYSDKFEEWVQAVDLAGKAVAQRNAAREERDEVRRELATLRLKFAASQTLVEEYRAKAISHHVEAKGEGP